MTKYIFYINSGLEYRFETLDDLRVFEPTLSGKYGSYKIIKRGDDGEQILRSKRKNRKDFLLVSGL